MGFDPRTVDQMTLWEFAACVDGYLISQGVKRQVDPDVISDDWLAQNGVEGF